MENGLKKLGSTGAMVHETAEIEDGAMVGAGSVIWHYCHIRAGARIGKNVSIGRNCYIDSGASLGDGCRLQNNVNVYKGVSLGRNVFVGPNSTFTNDKYPRATSGPDWTLYETVIGDGASICAGCVIAPGVKMGEGSMLDAGAVLKRNTAPYERVSIHGAHQNGTVGKDGKPIGG